MWCWICGWAPPVAAGVWAKHGLARRAIKTRFLKIIVRLPWRSSYLSSADDDHKMSQGTNIGAGRKAHAQESYPLTDRNSPKPHFDFTRNFGRAQEICEQHLLQLNRRGKITRRDLHFQEYFVAQPIPRPPPLVGPAEIQLFHQPGNCADLCSQLLKKDGHSVAAEARKLSPIRLRLRISKGIPFLHVIQNRTTGACQWMETPISVAPVSPPAFLRDAAVEAARAEPGAPSRATKAKKPRSR